MLAIVVAIFLVVRFTDGGTHGGWVSKDGKLLALWKPFVKQIRQLMKATDFMFVLYPGGAVQCSYCKEVWDCLDPHIQAAHSHSREVREAWIYIDGGYGKIPVSKDAVTEYTGLITIIRAAHQHRLAPLFESCNESLRASGF